MLNQTSIEAANAATYVENYLDCVENFPDEVQRFITRIRELDVCYLNKVKAAQHWKDHAEKFPNQKKKSYIRMQQALSAAQEIGDEKMTTVQSLNERIEGRYRSLDYDFKSLDLRRDEQTPADNRDIQVLSNSAAANNASVLLMERPNKRARRGGRGDFSVSENNQNEPTSIDQTPRNQNPSGSNTTQKKTGAGKKKKRKSRQNTQVQREDNSPKEEPIIDPDEPTYCLCDQISYGEMIMCDNDLCPIEWFHFSCVSLTTKPKGKWYCPKCRGDRPNVMKPKAQFLRELEKYNKEKEEKT